MPVKMANVLKDSIMKLRVYRFYNIQIEIERNRAFFSAKTIR